MINFISPFLNKKTILYNGKLRRTSQADPAKDAPLDSLGRFCILFIEGKMHAC